ncbi:MAG: phenylacetate-CoA oxygenase subunit PaaJ [Planctomycetes bacterium]|nr:phenylacetate-CoA oxygenase subunit PaaJ [Planctomycetota bacterium]
MTTTDSIFDVLSTIPDPEMPISITDLGLVEDVRVEAGPEGEVVSVDILPTFVGCPALDMIRGDIENSVGSMPGVGSVRVSFLYDPPWTVDRITDAGRESLREHGVTVPERGGRPDDTGDGGTTPLGTSAVKCPFCGSDRTRLDSPFGPTRCRMIFYCDGCRNTFERLKRVASDDHSGC